MNHYTKNLFILISALLLILPLQAQDTPNSTNTAPNGKNKANTKGIRVRILAFATIKEADRIVIQANKKLTSEFKIPTHGLSPYISVPGRTLSLGLNPADPELPIEPLAKVQLPEQGKEFLLIMIPNKTGYHCKAIRLDGTDFKAGDTLFLNTGKVTVGGIIGKEKFSLKPGKLKIIGAPPQNDLPYYQVKFYYSHKKKTRIFSDSRWPHELRTRSYVFFYMRPNTRRVTYRAVDEYLSVKDTKE